MISPLGGGFDACMLVSMRARSYAVHGLSRLIGLVRLARRVGFVGLIHWSNFWLVGLESNPTHSSGVGSMGIEHTLSTNFSVESPFNNLCN